MSSSTWFDIWQILNFLSLCMLEYKCVYAYIHVCIWCSVGKWVTAKLFLDQWSIWVDDAWHIFSKCLCVYMVSYMKLGTQRFISMVRRSYRRCSRKIGILENLSKLRGKYLDQCLFFNKVAGLRTQETILKQYFFLVKKRLWYRCFSAIFVKCLRTPFLT